MRYLLICILAAGLTGSALLANTGNEGPEKPQSKENTGFNACLIGNSSTGLIPGEQKKYSKLGILFSAVVPGSGEMYTRSWVKGILFLGAETALIAVSVKSSRRGQQWEDEFHEYADTHWREDIWQAGYNADDPSTHSLPDTKTQQYYEMIGKYDQFMKGWDDWVNGGPDLTPHRDKYETMRHNSNIQFIRASYCAMGLLANHLISAFDTAFTIRNKNRITAGMRVSMMQVRNDWVPALNLQASW